MNWSEQTFLVQNIFKVFIILASIIFTTGEKMIICRNFDRELLNFITFPRIFRSLLIQKKLIYQKI